MGCRASEPQSPAEAKRDGFVGGAKGSSRSSADSVAPKQPLGPTGMRVGEAAHPGPSGDSGEGIDVADWSSSDEEDLVEAQREKTRNKRGQQKHGAFARARKAVRKSRAKKVGHVVALKNSFFQGLKGDATEPNVHVDEPMFSQKDWQDLCERLYSISFKTNNTQMLFFLIGKLAEAPSPPCLACFYATSVRRRDSTLCHKKALKFLDFFVNELSYEAHLSV